LGGLRSSITPLNMTGDFPSLLRRASSAITNAARWAPLRTPSENPFWIAAIAGEIIGISSSHWSGARPFHGAREGSASGRLLEIQHRRGFLNPNTLFCMAVLSITGGRRALHPAIGMPIGHLIVLLFLADPNILNLDEATSAVDSLTETKIERVLQVLFRGRTSFVIAHRLSTVHKADGLLVLGPGTSRRARHKSGIGRGYWCLCGHVPAVSEWISF
jgi:hypothetical protein